MRRALAKAHPRVAAVDDGPFSRRDRRCVVAAVVVALPEQLEAAGTCVAAVDGRDATERIGALLAEVLPSEGVRAVLLDGVVVAGFNVVDLDRLYERVRIPLVAVTRRPPDFPRIRAALFRYFPRTAERRWAAVRRHRLFPVPTGGVPIWAAAVGCPRADAVRLLRRTSVRGFWPEPLRLAHLLARAASPRGGRRNGKSIGRPRPRRRRGPVA